jgi:hypothetical protein
MRKILVLLLLLIFHSPLFALERQWKSIGPHGADVYLMAPDRNHPNLWYSIFEISLYRSVDYGRSWKKILENVDSFAVHPKDSSLYVISHSIFGEGAFISKSIDQGSTFQTLGNVPATNLLRLDPNLSGLMYVGTTYDKQIFRSTDEGKSWAELTISFDLNSDFF